MSDNASAPLAPRRPTSASLVSRLVEERELVSSLRALPPRQVAALVRHIGAEDAGGQLVALVTTEQLVAIFDEDLFTGTPGERESFDVERFALWLEVLMEAGEEAASRRVAELSEEFVVHGVHSLALVLDHDALMLRFAEGGDAGFLADKALESALCEELDGYLLVSRGHHGWDALLALILALDRDHRALLERLLDRCAALCSPLVEDLDELTSALSSAESLAEDVEAAREERRSREGYVDPRQARAFLRLAREGLGAKTERDPITRAYLRELAPPEEHVAPRAAPAEAASRRRVLALIDTLDAPEAASVTTKRAARDEVPRFIDAMTRLASRDAAIYQQRTVELAFLANVIAAGATLGGERFTRASAAEAALATVALGAELAVGRGAERASVEELVELLVETGADRLFRRASGALADADSGPLRDAFLHGWARFEELLSDIRIGRRTRK